MNDRILDRKLEFLEQKQFISTEKIENWNYRLANFKTPQDIKYLTEWQDFNERMSFEPLVTIFFETTYTIPEDKNYFYFNIQNAEALLRIDGKAYAGVDLNHRLIPIEKDIKGKTVKLELEMMSMLRAQAYPEQAVDSTISFKTAIVDEDVRAFFYDLKLLREVSVLETHERRKKMMDKLLEDSMLLVDLTNGEKSLFP